MNKTPVAQLNVRIPRDVLEELRTHAAMAEKPVSAVVLEAIRKCLDDGEVGREAQPDAPSPGTQQQPGQQPKAPPTIPHQPQAHPSRRPRPRRRIPIAVLAVILAVSGAIGMMYWIASGIGLGSTGWLRSAAILAIVHQAQAAEQILAVGSEGLRSCLDNL